MATSTRKKSTSLHTPPGVAAYANLFVPRARKDAKGNVKGDPKYGLALFFEEGTNLKAMKALALEKAVEKFGPNVKSLIDKGKIRWPFEDTADLDDPSEPFDQPGTRVNFKSGDKPGIVDADAEPIMDKSEVYSGMICRVSCRCFAYDNESKGVSFALINVQKLADGTRMSGNPSAEDDFGGTPTKGKRKVDDDDDEPAPRKGKRRVADDDDVSDLL